MAYLMAAASTPGIATRLTVEYIVGKTFPYLQGRDINLDIKRVVAYRHWCNKLWNAIKFAMINLGQDFVPAAGALQSPAKLPFACQWILSRLTAAIHSTVKALHEYQFSTATQVSICRILLPFISAYGTRLLPGRCIDCMTPVLAAGCPFRELDVVPLSCDCFCSALAAVLDQHWHLPGSGVQLHPH